MESLNLQINSLPCRACYKKNKLCQSMVYHYALPLLDKGLLCNAKIMSTYVAFYDLQKNDIIFTDAFAPHILPNNAFISSLAHVSN